MLHTFSKIGFHLDLRIQVPPLPALKRMADNAARNGANILLVEWEAAFPFDRHAIISNGYAYTQREVAAFVRHCAERGVDVVPLQQCFGHIEYILRHQRYAHLRESGSDLGQLCPCRTEEAAAVFREIFQEVAGAHPSPYFHLGGDETHLLGHCPSCREFTARHGASQLYVLFLKRMAEEAIALGKRPLIWIDMLLKHQAAAAQMPAECIFVDWNYGWPVDRFGDFSKLTSLPFEFWGAAAMRSAPDNHSAFSWLTHFENLRDYIPVARQRKFQGMILTSWATSGVYGYEWEANGRPQCLHPVRRTVPHAALPILTAAFGAAVRQAEPLDFEAFIVGYGRKRFGFSNREAALFLKTLTQSSLPDPTGSSSERSLRNLQRARRIFRGLTPLRNAREFQRYLLMTDLSEHHLRTQMLENASQGEKAGSRQLSVLARKAALLLREAEALNRRFASLFGGELYPGELEKEIEFRLKALRQFHNRVTRAERNSSPDGAVSFARATGTVGARSIRRKRAPSDNGWGSVRIGDETPG